MKVRFVNTLLEDFVKSSLEFGKLGNIVAVDTSVGKAKFAIDTGSNISCIRDSFVKNRPETKRFGLPFVDSDKFEVADKNFGGIYLHLQDITPELTEIDGILGTDFLRQHVVYLDRQNKLIYLKESITRSGEVREESSLEPQRNQYALGF
jgi:hypothetical protein